MSVAERIVMMSYSRLYSNKYISLIWMNCTHVYWTVAIPDVIHVKPVRVEFLAPPTCTGNPYPFIRSSFSWAILAQNFHFFFLEIPTENSIQANAVSWNGICAIDVHCVRRTNFTCVHIVLSSYKWIRVDGRKKNEIFVISGSNEIHGDTHTHVRATKRKKSNSSRHKIYAET